MGSQTKSKATSSLQEMQLLSLLKALTIRDFIWIVGLLAGLVVSSYSLGESVTTQKYCKDLAIAKSEIGALHSVNSHRRAQIETLCSISRELRDSLNGVIKQNFTGNNDNYENIGTIMNGGTLENSTTTFTIQHK